MKVSIITVCFNSETFISSAIQSVLSQDYSNIEYIIIDGGSRDSTPSIIESFGDQVDYFVSEPDKGIYDAMNKGVFRATGDIIGILNSDDFYCDKSTISKVVEAFKTEPSTHMVLGNIDFVKLDKLDEPVRHYSSYRFKPWKMRFGFMPAHPGAFIKSSAYQKVGNYKLGYKIAADFEWFVRAFFLKNLQFIKLNETLVRMREGGVSSSGLQSYKITTYEILKALKSNGVYSNTLMVISRLPVKALQKVMGVFR